MNKERSFMFRVARLMYITFPGLTFGLYLGLGYQHYYFAAIYMGWLLCSILLLD